MTCVHRGAEDRTCWKTTVSLNCQSAEKQKNTLVSIFILVKALSQKVTDSPAISIRARHYVNSKWTAWIFQLDYRFRLATTQ